MPDYVGEFVRAEIPEGRKQRTNLTMSQALVEEAKHLGVNVSKAAESGVAAAVAQKRADRWLLENRDALDSMNRFVEENGIPLAKYRNF